jgi:hypothetical protein
MVAQALARGNTGGPAVTLADARSATNVGCIEPVIPGKDSGYLYYSMPNLAAIMEQVLTNGRGRRGMGPERIDHLFWRWLGPLAGLATGDPRGFQSFDEVLTAYRRQHAGTGLDGPRADAV